MVNIFHLSIIDIQKKVDAQMAINQELALQVKSLRKREIEIVKRWDLDDIDLVTERLKGNLCPSHLL